MTTAKKNIHQRIVEVMNEVSYIQKDNKAGMKYSVVSHDKVTAKLRPAIINAGISYYPIRIVHSQDGNRTECAMTVRFTNIDNPDDFIDVQSLGYGIDAQDKGPGKAQSYAVKYALLKTFGLETGDEPEEDQVTPHTPQVVYELEPIEASITTAATVDDLKALLTEHGATISEASKHEPARVAKLKQQFSARKKELEDA